MYYNTTSLSGDALKSAKKKAVGQEEIIATFFQRIGGQYTPSEIHNKLFRDSTPITSVRRAICGLTEKGILTRTEKKRPGPFGRHEYVWGLKNETN